MGVSDGDHRTVVATIEWDQQPIGYERPVGSIAHKLTKEQVTRFDELMEEHMSVDEGAGIYCLTYTTRYAMYDTIYEMDRKIVCTGETTAPM